MTIPSRDNTIATAVKRLIAAIYVRVSTIMQAESGYSMDAQEALLREYCEAKGYEVYRVYRDEGLSGKDVKRPALQQMLADVVERKIDVVCVWKLSRLTRSVQDLYNMCATLERQGAHLDSYTEAIDMSTAMGRMTLGIMGVVAQWERDVISDNVRMAMRERAMQGYWTASYVLGYDRVGDTYTVNKAEAAQVRAIYDDYLRHGVLNRVVAMCKQRGYRGKLGGQPTPEGVYRILTNFFYCGYYAWHKRPIAALHDPIVSVAEFNRVQTRIIARAASGGRKRLHAVTPLDASAVIRPAILPPPPRTKQLRRRTDELL